MARKIGSHAARNKKDPRAKTARKSGMIVPDFVVPPALAQADAQTLTHMQRTLGNQVVQRYLATRGHNGSELFGVVAPGGINPGRFTSGSVQRQDQHDETSDGHTIKGMEVEGSGAATGHTVKGMEVEGSGAPTGHTVKGMELEGSGAPTGHTVKGMEVDGGGAADGHTVKGMEVEGGDAAGGHTVKGMEVTGGGSQLGAPGATAPGATAPAGARPTLYQGSQGAWVTTLQNKLRATGYSLDVDGIFGPITRGHVRHFQEQARLTPDGVVGRRTWEALDAVARGGALSDADLAQMDATEEAARAAFLAENYESALELYASMYRDPRTATKPHRLIGVIFNMAGCYQNLAARDTRPDARQTMFDQAINLYLEHNAIPTTEDNFRAAAIMRIRECRMGLPATPFGQLEATMNEMNPDGAAVPAGQRPTLSLGSRSPWVTTLQNKLRAIGNDPSINGIFDAVTQDYVRRFQEQSRLTPDGVVGRRTWEALDSVARGGALSDADLAQIGVTRDAAQTAFLAGNYESALDLYASMYRDPRLANKPHWLTGVVFNMAGCLQNLGARETRPAERQTLFERAINLYMEHNAMPNLPDHVRAAGSIRIRECRMGQPATPFSQLEGSMNEMNPDGAAVPAGARPTLSPGSRSPWVTTLQNKLRAVGNDLPISGILDATTQMAVRRFQEQSRLTPDGVVGRRTWEALDSVARGGALSDADLAELHATDAAGRAAFQSGNYETSLDLYASMYRDPRLAAKPHWLTGVIFNMAGSLQNLGARETRSDAQQTLFDRAIDLYMEHNAMPNLPDDIRAAVSIRIRECRMGQPATPFTELEEAMNDMNPSAQ